MAAFRRSVTAVGVLLAATGGAAGCAAGEPASRPWTRPQAEAYATDPPTGSPVKDLTADRALEEAVANTADASVRVRGRLTDQFGVDYRLDMRFGKGGSSGTIASAGTAAHLLRVGDDVWIKATYEFWAAVGGSNFAAEYRDKYVKAPADNQAFAALIRYTYADKLIARFLDGAGRPVKGSGESTVDGRPAVPLRTKGGNGYGGTVWVSADGAPQLLRITAAEGSPIAGSIDFTEYGKRYEPAAPRLDQVAD